MDSDTSAFDPVLDCPSLGERMGRMSEIRSRPESGRRPDTEITVKRIQIP